MAQEHGGALRVGNPGNVGGGRAAAERRRVRVQRDEAIDDAVTGHIEKLSAIMGQLVDEAGGDQYRRFARGDSGDTVHGLSFISQGVSRGGRDSGAALDSAGPARA